MHTRCPFTTTLLTLVLGLAAAGIAAAQGSVKSITSTSQNRSVPPSVMVAEQPRQNLPGYRVVAANDLGMHCGDLDHRIASILPPFNILHAQALKTGLTPVPLDSRQVQLFYSAASNPRDPAAAASPAATVFKTNFWDLNPRGTGNTIAFDAYNPHYPPGVLAGFPLKPDIGLPVPDLQRFYLGDGQLVMDRQAMPSATGFQLQTQPYFANVPQPFALYYSNFPFFVKFPFGYLRSGINWFSAEGIPATPFDDAGRLNPYPLMRIQAKAVAGNTLGVAPGTVVASLDVVVPVSSEVNCQACHSSAVDGGNGTAIKYLPNVATRFNDPLYGQVPQAVSIEYAFDLNIVRLHDLKHGTHLEQMTPVSCQMCHYTPALDLAHLGPQGPGGALANGRQQNIHQTFSRVMHGFHGNLKNPDGSPVFPAMPLPSGRSIATRDAVLNQTCYQCHPGRITKCFRGAMANAGSACQDCHGGLTQVANDFSRNVSATNPGAFVLASDYYTNSATPRVPWANEPMCQSCHTGDVISNLAGSTNVIKAADGIRLLQAYHTNDVNAKPIVAVNRRFAENVISTKQVLFRLSEGHGGLFCEACHGSTHAEWPNADPNANDNVTAGQLQGHVGKLIECQTCHGSSSFPLTAFQGSFDANGLMKGPHGMHPVNDAVWNHEHEEVFKDSRSPKNLCQSCHGAQLQGTPLARTAADRTLECKETSAPGCVDTPQGKRIFLAKGTLVSCSLCHPNPLNSVD